MAGSRQSGYYDVAMNDSIMTVYCAKETHGGGWMLLTPELASIAGASWKNGGQTSHLIQGTGKSYDCQDYSNYAMKVYDIVPEWSEIRMDLHRGTYGVQQCSRFRDMDNHVSVPFTSFRVEPDKTETPYGLCQWNDGSWAYSTGTRYGRDKEWRIYAPRMSDNRNHMYYTMVCGPYWERYYSYDADLWIR
jgi:hypothetical protein